MSLRPQAPAAAAPRPEDRLKTVLQVGMMQETPGVAESSPDPSWWSAPAESIQRQPWWTAEWKPEVLPIGSMKELQDMLGQESLSGDRRLMVISYLDALQHLDWSLKNLADPEQEKYQLVAAQSALNSFAYRTFLQRDAIPWGPPNAFAFFVKRMQEGYDVYKRMGAENEQIQAAQLEAMNWLVKYDMSDDPFESSGHRSGIF